MIIYRNELQIGEIYVGIINNYGKKGDIIFKFNGNLNNEDNFFISAAIDKPRYFKIGSCCTDTSLKFRKATQQEKDWLNECIKQNKYIPLEEINKQVDNFPIY